MQNVQALVGSVRNGDQMAMIRSNAGSILEDVDIILGAVEGGMETRTSFQTMFTNKTLSAFEALSQTRMTLEQLAHDSVQHDNKPSAKEFTQSLPPLAFQIAREAKDLAARAEQVVSGAHDSADGEDFS